MTRGRPSADLSAPVGVFDSGVGGLSVLEHIHSELPAEDVIYFADSANAPYGDKPGKFIETRCLEITRLLVESRHAKAFVVACNTATAAAVATLRAEHQKIPIVAMEPGVKPAVGLTKSGVIGVMATRNTLASAKFTSLLDRFGHKVRVLTQPCAGLVEQVEARDFDGPRTRSLLEASLRPLLSEGCDVIVLGCTHYPFLSLLISEIVGPDVSVVDTGPAVARQLRRRLADAGLERSDSGHRGSVEFLTSGAVTHLRSFTEKLWPDGSVHSC